MGASAAAVQAALLDTIALGESEPEGTPRGAGYNKLCGGGTFSDFSKFPDWPGVEIDGVLSHAAGRYQDEPKTWAWIAGECRLSDFTPASQDKGNAWLAGHEYRAHTGRDLWADLAAGRTMDAVPALRSTWPSLDEASFGGRFKTALAARVAEEPQPMPEPVAPAPRPPVPPISAGSGVALGGTTAAALATVLIWLSHWPIQPLDGGTALSMASLVLGALGAWMHMRSR